MAVRHQMEGHQEIFGDYINLHFIEEDLLLVPMINSSKSLWRYNFAKNEWNEWHKFDKISAQISYHTSKMNDDQTKLYVFGDPGTIAVIDLKTGEIVESNRQFHDGAHSRSLYIDNQFHVFGGWNEYGRAHFVYDEEKKELNEIHKFNFAGDAPDNLAHHAVCYIESINSAFIVHNIDSRVYLYSLNSNKCQLLDYVKVVEKHFFHKAFWLGDNRILLYASSWIGILDLGLEKISECALKTPENVDYPLMKSDEHKRKMVVFGYIHQQRELEDNNIPMDIIKIIKSFCSFDYLYFIGYGEYFSLDVDEIIKHVNCD